VQAGMIIARRILEGAERSLGLKLNRSESADLDFHQSQVPARKAGDAEVKWVLARYRAAILAASIEEPTNHRSPLFSTELEWMNSWAAAVADRLPSECFSIGRT
jgi:hypothetical protein